jgi:hypothetical protein
MQPLGNINQFNDEEAEENMVPSSDEDEIEDLGEEEYEHDYGYLDDE